ncbi:MAG TPA: hypothetical protein VKD72_02065, partial [Gemmataceae bacterium]|nr:hypothetical protein [Gemmataceae bacterium]
VTTTIQTYLAPELIGRDPFDLPDLHAAMNRAIAPSFSTGQPLAKAGLDLALWDLTGRLLGQSLAERWGRDERQLYIPPDGDWISRFDVRRPALQRRLDFPIRCGR